MVVAPVVVARLLRRGGVTAMALRVACRQLFIQASLNGAELSIDIFDAARKLCGVRRCGDRLDGGRQIDDAIIDPGQFFDRQRKLPVDQFGSVRSNWIPDPVMDPGLPSCPLEHACGGELRRLAFGEFCGLELSHLLVFRE
ncbi:hypothetical protein HPB49_003404 [Dermacentor silvarum]|uniref:Uncharacterized protein n=1 Tax=Dermacentor silvarum TaxID=543639 RepID=A0ACB8C750_DERSI|nr:hypothetical protein HPB49_003404 [Dermacentor silvarum]